MMVTRLLIWCGHLYRVVLSPYLGGRCRFVPSCSEYADEALRTRPLCQALRLIGRRLLRCHPFGGKGLDPVA